MCSYYINELDAIKNMSRFELNQLKSYYENLLKSQPENNELINKIQSIKLELLQNPVI